MEDGGGDREGGEGCDEGEGGELGGVLVMIRDWERGGTDLHFGEFLGG